MALPHTNARPRPSAQPLSWVPTPAYRTIAHLIRERGTPISFREFMHIALYGDAGYYTGTRDRRVDYLTSPQTHSEFGACIARCLHRMWSAIDKPDRFSVLELGSGDGSLWRDASNEIKRTEDSGNQDARDFYNAIRYECHDIQLDTSQDGTAWPAYNQPRAEVAGPFQCILSNELLDAFPVNRYIIQDSELRELMVDINEDGKLLEIACQFQTDSITHDLGRPVSDYPDGYVIEFAPGIRDWAYQVHQSVPRGYVLTIDYGHPRNILYRPDRVGGTLRCYKNQVLGSDPFREVGQQDITAHVDFTLVNESLAKFNFKPSTPLMSQTDFLYHYGYGDTVMETRRKLVQAHDAEASIQLKSDLASLMALTDPRGLGGFKVAIHGRGVPQMPHDTEGLTDED